MLKTIERNIALRPKSDRSRFSFTRGSNCDGFDWESACVLPDTGGRIWEVVAHVGSTVLTTTFDQQRFIKKPTNKNLKSVKRRCETACMINACTDLQRN